MKRSTAAVAVVAFAAGALTFGALNAARDPLSHHWRIVNDYRAYLRDPANWQTDPGTGLSSTTLPPDPMPSLAVLVEAGELRHADLVLPTVRPTKLVAQYWMRWAERHDDVVFMSGNPSYTGFDPAGEQPLHLQVWFRESATADVQKLIRDLEGIAAVEQRGPRQAAAPAIPPHPLRERLIGHWEEDGETTLRIIEAEDKTVRL